MPLRLLAAFCALLATADALAGSGPWTLGQDDRSVYIGSSYTRWDRLHGGEGSQSPGSAQLPSAFTRTDLVGILSYGVAPWAEFELQGSLAWAAVGRADEGVCLEIDDGCTTTAGLAPVTARFKARVFDELGAAPLSVAVGGLFRFGDFTRGRRHRLTSIGDGQTDLGVFLALGRAGAIGRYGASVWGEAQYRYRLPVATVGGDKLPPDEVQFDTEILFNPVPTVALGFTLNAVDSLGGYDIEQMDKADDDRFTGLSVTSIKAGGKLNVRSVNNVTFSVSGLGTVLARNNPGDFFTLGVGIGLYQPSRSR